MAPSHWVGRLAWAGLVLTVLMIAGGMLAAGVTVRKQTSAVATESALDNAYDDATDAWTRAASLPAPRSHVEAATFVRYGQLLLREV